MNLRYYLGVLLAIPFIPILKYQGKKVFDNVPKLPEAKGPEGKVEVGFQTNNELRLITLGESTIAGVGVETHEEGFTGTLAKELSKLLSANIHWRAYAHSGYTAKRVLQEIVPKIKEKEIGLIVIGLGANDAFTVNTPENWTKDIRKLIDVLKKNYPKALIVFCNMPPIKEFPAFPRLLKFFVGNLVEIFGQELIELVKSYENVYYASDKMSLADWVKRNENVKDASDFFSDGVHPSKLTYQAWAIDMANSIVMNKKLARVD